MDGFRSTLSLIVWQGIGSGSPGEELRGRVAGRRYDKHRLTILGFMCRLHC